MAAHHSSLSLIAVLNIIFPFRDRGHKNQKSDFLCYCFEQGYLSSYYFRYHYDIFYESSSYPFQGKRVSDISFRP